MGEEHEHDGCMRATHRDGTAFCAIPLKKFADRLCALHGSPKRRERIPYAVVSAWVKDGKVATVAHMHHAGVAKISLTIRGNVFCIYGAEHMADIERELVSQFKLKRVALLAHIESEEEGSGRPPKRQRSE